MDKHTNKWLKDFKIKQESYEIYLANVNSYLEYLIKSTSTNTKYDDGHEDERSTRPHYQYYTPTEIDRPRKRSFHETITTTINNKMPLVDPFVFKRPKTPL